MIFFVRYKQFCLTLFFRCINPIYIKLFDKFQTVLYVLLTTYVPHLKNMHKHAKQVKLFCLINIYIVYQRIQNLMVLIPTKLSVNVLENPDVIHRTLSCKVGR